MRTIQKFDEVAFRVGDERHPHSRLRRRLRRQALECTMGQEPRVQDVHIRDTVKYSDYKQFGSSSKIIFNGQEIKPEKPQTTQPNNPPKQ